MEKNKNPLFQEVPKNVSNGAMAALLAGVTVFVVMPVLSFKQEANLIYISSLQDYTHDDWMLYEEGGSDESLYGANNLNFFENDSSILSDGLSFEDFVDQYFGGEDEDVMHASPGLEPSADEKPDEIDDDDSDMGQAEDDDDEDDDDDSDMGQAEDDDDEDDDDDSDMGKAEDDDEDDDTDDMGQVDDD